MESHPGPPPGGLSDPADGTAESINWDYMLTGHSRVPVEGVTPADEQKIHAMIATLNEEKVFIDTDVQSDLLAEPDFEELFNKYVSNQGSSSGSSGQNVAPPDAINDISAFLPGSGDVDFRFGHHMGSSFSFPNVGPVMPSSSTIHATPSGAAPAIVAPSPSSPSPPSLPSPPTAANPLPPLGLSPPAAGPSGLGPQPQETTGLHVPQPARPAAGFMASPVPSRPSSPPLRPPILGFTSAILKLNHAVRHNSSRDVPYRGPTASPSPAWSPPPQPSNVDPRITELFVEKHQEKLLRTIDKALLTGVAGTYNDSEAASEFITRHPDQGLQEPLDELFNQVWWDSCLDPLFNVSSKTHDVVRAEVATKVGGMISNDSRIVDNVREGKGLIADFLSDVFTYTFDVLANKKDSALLGIKEEASPALARDRINTIASLMFYAHLAVFLDYVTDAPPITVNSHPEVDDFRQLTTPSEYRQATTMLHRHKAHNRLVEMRSAAERVGQPWNPSPTQHLLLSQPPRWRFGYDYLQLLRIVMPGSQREVYFLNFQAPFLLFVVRFVMVLLHRRTSRPGQQSVVLRYFLQQKDIPPRSPHDSIWRLVILPLAICAAVLYVIRENIEEFMKGTITALDAMEKTPKVALVFQAKILAVEKVLYEWKANPVSNIEYLLLRHRLLEILADVVRPGDDYIGYDLVGPVFHATEADHYAYYQSFTTRDHTLRGFTEPLITRAPSILESSYLASSRSPRAVISLLRETLI